MPPVTGGLSFAPEVVAARYWSRLTITVAFICMNLILILSIRRNAYIDPDVARTYLVYVEVTLAIDLLISATVLRRSGRAHRIAVAACAVIEVATVIVWVYLTGIVSSYFTLMPLLFTVVFRFVYDYTTALVATLTSVVLFVLAFQLQRAGLVPAAPLLREAPMGIYAMHEFQDAAATNILLAYVGAFFGVNLAGRRLVLREQALADVQRALRLAVDQARLGRLSGTHLGDYAVEDLLGRGGMGEVYAAKRSKDGKQVAIKLLHAHLGAEPEMRARFRREAEVVRKMPAGTVAVVYEFGTNEDGYDYIVMEQLRGEDLGALLRRRERLELDEVLAIVDGVATGLDAAHALGVVHRDLKPQNVFLCGTPGTGERPDVRLLDFGVARLHEAAFAQSMTATAAVIGTPGYMPPEQAGGGTVGPPADVFALGAIVYRALTGKAAFPSRSPAGALFEALNYDPPPPSEAIAGLPRDVDAVLTLALAKDPALRYQRASELARDLAAAVRGELDEASRRRAAKLVRPPVTAGTMTAG